MHKTLLISHIDINDHCLSLILNQPWDLDNFSVFINLFNSLLAKDFKVKDINTGADRYSLYFVWQQTDWIAHFDYYSQSIWIEARFETESNIKNYQLLASSLT
jgi:hypothetical protein